MMPTTDSVSHQEPTSDQEVTSNNSKQQDLKACGSSILQFIGWYGLPALEFADFATNVLVTSDLYQKDELLWAVLATCCLIASAGMSSKIGAEPLKSDYEYKKHRNRYLYDSTLHNLTLKPREANGEKDADSCCCLNAPIKCLNGCLGMLPGEKKKKLDFFDVAELAANTQKAKKLGSLLGLIHLWPFFFLAVSMKILPSESEKPNETDEESRKEVEKKDWQWKKSPSGKTKSRKEVEKKDWQWKKSPTELAKEWGKTKRHDWILNRFIGATFESCPQLFLQAYVVFDRIQSGTEVPNLLLISIIISFASQVWAMVQWWSGMFGGEHCEQNKTWASVVLAFQLGSGLVAKVLMFAYCWAYLKYTAYFLLILMLPARFMLFVYWEQVSPFLVFMRIPFDFLLIKSFPVAVGAMVLQLFEMILMLSLPPDNDVSSSIVSVVVLCWAVEKAAILFLAREYHLSIGLPRRHLFHFFCCRFYWSEGQPILFTDTQDERIKHAVIHRVEKDGKLTVRLNNSGEKTTIARDNSGIQKDDKNKMSRWLGLEQLWMQQVDKEERFAGVGTGAPAHANTINRTTSMSQDSSHYGSPFTDEQTGPHAFEK